MTEARVVQAEPETVPLSSYLRVLRERKWWIIAVVGPLIALALVYSYIIVTPTYQATASLLRQTTSFDQGLFDTRLFDTPDVASDLQTGSRLVKLDTVAQMVKEDLGSPRSIGSLRSMVTVSRNPNTQILEITAVSTDPMEAAEVSNSFAEQFVRYRRDADRAAISQARQQVEQQIEAMSASERASERASILIQKTEELRILESMQTGGYEIVQEASIPDAPFSPRPVRNGMLALAVGLFLGVLLAFVVDRLDRRIKSVESLEGELGLPVLAAIPRVGNHKTPEDGEPLPGCVSYTDQSPQFVEAFRTLRSNLKYFEFDRQIRTIVVTSGLPQEGKTVTTVNLAISLALAGARVTVIEADLRRPMVHRYLQVRNDRGVSDVLAGSYNLQEATQQVKIEQDSLPKQLNLPRAPEASLLSHGLSCLPSGPLPPNPAEFIGSEQMRWLIEDAASMSDYVLIDTPPVLLVADALSLVGHVDAVILCARIDSSTIDEAHRVSTLLERTGARTLGVVAGGIRGMSESAYHSYGYFSPEQASGDSANGSGHLQKGRSTGLLPEGRRR